MFGKSFRKFVTQLLIYLCEFCKVLEVVVCNNCKFATEFVIYHVLQVICQVWNSFCDLLMQILQAL